MKVCLIVLKLEDFQVELEDEIFLSKVLWYFLLQISVLFSGGKFVGWCWKSTSVSWGLSERPLPSQMFHCMSHTNTSRRPGSKSSVLWPPHQLHVKGSEAASQRRGLLIYHVLRVIGVSAQNLLLVEVLSEVLVGSGLKAAADGGESCRGQICVIPSDRFLWTFRAGGVWGVWGQTDGLRPLWSRRGRRCFFFLLF